MAVKKTNKKATKITNKTTGKKNSRSRPGEIPEHYNITRWIVDTSLFVNPHARAFFGKTPTMAVRGFLKKVKRLKNLHLYMPPVVFNELRNFVAPKEIHEFELVVKKRAPSLYDITLPAAITYDFIEDVRNRINKGLRLAEEFAQDNRPENEQKLQKLREKYRSAVRTGLVDSREDFELLLLAKELDAVIISSDEGILKFANKMGCEWLNASKVYSMLKRIS